MSCKSEMLGPPTAATKKTLSLYFLITMAIGMTFSFGFTYMALDVLSWETASTSSHRQRVTKPTSNHRHREELENDAGSTADVHFEINDEFQSKDGQVAEQLAKNVRVLCWIMTSPNNHKKKAVHVKATWGRRCNILLFMSSVADPELPTVALNVTEGRNHLWAKTKEAFSYVYRYYLDQADWFMKADDDTYVVVENLRYFLMSHNTSEPVYFGCRFKPFIKQGYMSGGAGYVLSREALKRFSERGLTNEFGGCRRDDAGAEDVEMGKCLEKVGVIAGDSRDSMGRTRFFPLGPTYIGNLHVNKTYWYLKYIYYPSGLGANCCSGASISFHYIPPNMMYILEHLIYRLRPYGIQSQLVPID